MSESVVDQFHRAYYDAAKHDGTWKDTRWLGVPVLKCPLDLWLYQEILHEVQPDLVVETGTHKGGSALFLAGICALIGKGRVLTIDDSWRVDYPQHPRVAYHHGDSISLLTVETVRKAAVGKKVLVILDSDHHLPHVREELALYAPLVSPGSYLIVEDTNVNGNPVCPEHGPGPAEAVREFLASPAGSSFDPDPRAGKFLLSFNPGGYLRKRAP